MQDAAAVLSVLAGFTARLAMVYQTSTISKKTITVQILSTISLCFLAYIIKRDYRLQISIELLLCFVSFMSVVLISTFDEVAKNGIKSYLRSISDKYLGSSDGPKKDDQP